MRRLILLFGVLGTSGLAAQSAPLPPAEGVARIEDNSFLLEEAYNQAPGVVQHINAFSRPTPGPGWMYTFTQEWPLGGQKHQISYAIPFGRDYGGLSRAAAFGDIAINYRYQLRADGPLAVAPRMTVLLPSGASRRGLGSGGTGLQVSLPFSALLSKRIVTHTNAGVTYTPRARDPSGNVAATTRYSLGQSAIWLVHPKLNLLLETTWNSAAEVIGSGRTQRGTETLLSPGVRGAIDFASGLQIVPGVAFPFGIGSSRGARAVLVYLSFEHRFRRRVQ